MIIFEKKEVVKDDGLPYTVFTAYKNKYYKTLTAESFKAFDCQKYFTNKKDEDYKAFIAHLKQIRGAIRVSVGIATTTKDLEKYINLVNSLKNKAK